MSTRATLLTVIGVILFSLASDAVFVMKETERAVLLRFGALETADIAPGLHFKMPFADEVAISTVVPSKNVRMPGAGGGDDKGGTPS